MLEVLGQARAVGQLQRSLGAGRMPHAWMFAGPFGVGKFRLALALARAALCDRPVKRRNGTAVAGLPADFELTLACGGCESCRAITPAGGNHPDLHVITRELIRYHDQSGTSKGTTLSIQVIRGEITGDPDAGKEAKIAKRPFRGRGKWFIIDQADLMEPAAQNALLKTLEEPPPHSYLVLITTSPAELLATIRSRTQLVSFRELPDGVIRQALVGRGLPGTDAQLLACLGRGSLGRAVRWAEDMATITRENAKQQERASRRGGEGDGDEEDAPKFTPGGILAWTRQLAQALEGLVAGRNCASDVGTVIQRSAGEYASLQLLRDPLTSKDQATRDGVAISLGIAAEWFNQRLRQGLGVGNAAALPSGAAALEPRVAREVVRTAREAEWQVDANAHVGLTLAAATTQWERALRRG